MNKLLDIAGKRFGRLRAIEFVGRAKNNTFWLCQCDCGSTSKIRLSGLTTGNTKSCGCLKSELASKRVKLTNYNRRRFKENANYLGPKYGYYVRNAKLRHIVWNITPEEFEKLVSQNCRYCGSSDKIGVDRVNTNLPYEVANSAPCCTACNQAKNDRSVNQFADWIITAYNHLQAENWSR